jgi:hypothetical protein
MRSRPNECVKSAARVAVGRHREVDLGNGCVHFFISQGPPGGMFTNDSVLKQSRASLAATPPNVAQN